MYILHRVVLNMNGKTVNWGETDAFSERNSFIKFLQKFLCFFLNF